MFIGAISFFGRLTQRGWIVTVLACAVGAVLTFLVALEFVEGRRATIEERDAAVVVMFGMFALFGLTLLGATVRRLRDAGSPLPYVELLLGVIIPAAGWLWLLYRVVFQSTAPVVRAEEPNEVAQSAWRAPERSKAGGVAEDKPAVRAQSEGLAVDQPASRTVIRARRTVWPRPRRNVVI